MLGSRLIYIKRLASSVRNLNEEERKVFENLNKEDNTLLGREHEVYTINKIEI